MYFEHVNVFYTFLARPHHTLIKLNKTQHFILKLDIEYFFDTKNNLISKRWGKVTPLKPELNLF